MSRFKKRGKSAIDFKEAKCNLDFMSGPLLIEYPGAWYYEMNRGSEAVFPARMITIVF